MNQNNQQPAEAVGAVPKFTDAQRYQRLRILGAAPGGSKQLEGGTVLCFQNLDDYLDADIAAHPSRGEFKADAPAPLDLSELDLWSPIAGSKMEVDNACGQYVRFADVQSLLATHPAEPVGGDVRAALQFIHDTFKRDLDAGYKTRDKEFAVAIAARALRAPVGGALVAVSEYKPGQWFDAQTLDEMQAFYLSRLLAIREAAKEHGYAIGLHGSERRDFDLIAMQWRDGASDRDTLARAIADAACGIRREGAYEWEQKPAGRFAVSIPVCWTAHDNPDFDKPSVGHIDLSVIATPAGALVAMAEQDQAHVLPPTRGTDSQHNAIIVAIARGWCDPSNKDKPVDQDLVTAIAREVGAMLASRGRAQGGITSEKIDGEYFSIEDGVAHVHPEYGSGTFFTDDCKRASESVAAPADLIAEAVKLAPILRNMCEGGDLHGDGVDIYADDYMAGDGDTYVVRAAVLLESLVKKAPMKCEHVPRHDRGGPNDDAVIRCAKCGDYLTATNQPIPTKGNGDTDKGAQS